MPSTFLANAWLLDHLNDLITDTTGALDGAVVNLIGIDFEIDPTLTWGDLALPDFAAPPANRAIEWTGGAYLDDAGVATVAADAQVYALSGETGPVIIYGYKIGKGIGTPDLICAVKFPAQIVLDVDTEGFVFVPVFQISPIPLG